MLSQEQEIRSQIRNRVEEVTKIKKTICNQIIESSVADKMKELLRRTRQTGHEYGFLLCKKDDVVYTSRVCTGAVCEIEIRDGCDGGKILGSFHTHPRPVGIPVLDAITSAFKGHEFMCIGEPKKEILPGVVGKEDVVTCYNLSVHEKYNEIKDEISKLKNRIESCVREHSTYTGEIDYERISELRKNDFDSDESWNEFVSNMNSLEELFDETEEDFYNIMEDLAWGEFISPKYKSAICMFGFNNETR